LLPTTENIDHPEVHRQSNRKEKQLANDTIHKHKKEKNKEKRKEKKRHDVAHKL
jgi:hypothetical protein